MLLENWCKLPQAQSRHHSCLGIIKTQGMLQGEDKGDEEGGAEPGVYSTEENLSSITSFLFSFKMNFSPAHA